MKPCFVLSAIAIACLSSLPLSATELRLCSEYEEYVPSVLYPKGDGSEGESIAQRVEKAAKRIGLEITISRHPWKRCMKLVEQGDVDGLFPIIATNSREERYRFPQDGQGYLLRVDYPLFVLRGGAFDRDDTKTLLVGQQGLNDDLYRLLKQKGLAAPYGYVMRQRLMAAGFQGPDSIEPRLGLRQVREGKLDGYAIEREIGLTLLRLSGIDNVVPTRYPLERATWHVAFNRDFYRINREAVDKFWLALPGGEAQ